MKAFLRKTEVLEVSSILEIVMSRKLSTELVFISLVNCIEECCEFIYFKNWSKWEISINRKKVSSMYLLYNTGLNSRGHSHIMAEKEVR